MHVSTLTFQDWVESNSSRIFTLALRITGNRHDAEDVVQETFLKAYQRFHQFRKDSSEFTWLYRIATHCALDLLRKHQRKDAKNLPMEESGLHLVAPHPSPDDSLKQEHLRKQLRDALDELTPMEKTAFILRHYEGQNCTTIAEILECDNNRAKQAVFRAVKKLRTVLKPWTTQ